KDLQWLRDRFYLGGSPITRGKSAVPESDSDAVRSRRDALEWSERSFPGKGPFQRAYRVPLPPGRYRIVLHFVNRTLLEPSKGVFDVVLEGKTLLESYEAPRSALAVTDARSFDLTIDDGALDIDFVTVSGNAQVSGIEAVRVGS